MGETLQKKLWPVTLRSEVTDVPLSIPDSSNVGPSQLLNYTGDYLIEKIYNTVDGFKILDFWIMSCNIAIFHFYMKTEIYNTTKYDLF